MYQFGIVMSMIGIIFLAIIGVYVWTFKVYKDMKTSLGDIYSSMNGHIQNNTVHVGVDGCVSTKVCGALHTALKEKITGVDEKVNTIGIDVKILLQRNGS